MKTTKTLAALAAAWLATGVAWGANSLPATTVITGQVSGASSTLLGLGHDFADEPGTNTTVLSAAEQEFITGDAAIAIDFFADGRVQVWNNTGTDSLPGSYTLTFSFAGLSQPLSGFIPLDLSSVNGGTVSLLLVDAQSVSLTLNNVTFTNAEYPSFTAQLNVSAVPEPASVALLGAGLGLIALRRARRAA